MEFARRNRVVKISFRKDDNQSTDYVMRARVITLRESRARRQFEIQNSRGSAREVSRKARP